MKLHDMILEARRRGYYVTDAGQLLSPTGRVLVVAKRGKQRYPTFSIRVPVGIAKSRVWAIPVHKFAAYCFYGKRAFDVQLVVRHRKSNTEDISRTNILLGTHSQNNMDKPSDVRRAAAKKARAAQGSRAHNARLSSEEVREARMLHGEAWSLSRLASRYGVSKSTMHNLVIGACYADVS